MKVCLICRQQFQVNNWQCPYCGYVPPFQNKHPVFAPDLTEGDGFDANYKYEEIFDLEAKNFWFRARNRLLIWGLQQYFPETKNFLEIGCGTGFVLAGIQQAFPKLTLSASDILNRGLEYTKQRLPDVSFFQMDARHIPFEAEFDVIGAFDVIEHIEEDELVLAQLYQALKPKGGIILTVPQHPFLWSYLDDFSHHKRRYTRSELIAKVERAGFTVLHITSFVSLLLPLLFLSRLTRRQPLSDDELMTEFRLPSFLNMTLEKILDLERILIKTGVSLPAGGSLLLIAKR